MRYVYLGFMAFILVLGLIVCFENIVIQAPGVMIFFEPVIGSMFWPMLFIMMMGFIGGIFCGLAILSGKKDDNDYEDADI